MIFEQLPEELQIMILSVDEATLKLTPYISKNIYKICLRALSHIKISISEMIHYINHYSPNSIHILSIYDELEKKYVVATLTLIDPATECNKYKFKYRMVSETVIINNDHVSLTHTIYDGVVSKFHKTTHTKTELDFLTQYFIYQLRISCHTLSSYAKNKIINRLKLYKNPLDLNCYVDLLSWYMYLRTNLLRFPVTLKRNYYYDYKIIVDNKGYTNDVIFETLKTDCHYLYKQLLEQIDKL